MLCQRTQKHYEFKNYIVLKQISLTLKGKMVTQSKGCLIQIIKTVFYSRLPYSIQYKRLRHWILIKKYLSRFNILVINKNDRGMKKSVNIEGSVAPSGVKTDRVNKDLFRSLLLSLKKSRRLLYTILLSAII